MKNKMWNYILFNLIAFLYCLHVYMLANRYGTYLESLLNKEEQF